MADVAGLALTEEERDFLRHPAVGAVILFSRNFGSKAQVTELIRNIRGLREPPLLVAVDQEGGRVQRFKEGFHALPPLHALGAKYDEDPKTATELAYTAGCLMAAELRQVGIDFSFAPVLDTADLDSSIIGDRALHDRADIIAELAEPYIRGMESAGMRATGKHFPGHGGVRADSHLELPVDRRPWDEIWERDLLPYRKLAPILGGIMTAHVLFPEVDDDVPTFSGFWIRETLRQRIGFEGVVFSDDLTMKGAADVGPMPERARRAMAAGCDMVLVCNDPDGAREVAANLGPGTTGGADKLTAMAGSNPEIDGAGIALIADRLDQGLAT